MPLGFVFLGLILIYRLFFEKSKLNKILVVIFCFFTMCAYFVKPLNLGNVSLNLVVCFSAIILSFYSFLKLKNEEKFSLSLYLVVVAILYALLCIINIEFVTSINPYPLCFVLLFFGVLNLKNYIFVVCLNQFSFILINFLNLILERQLEFINLANIEFFNLNLIILFVLLFVRLVVTNLKFLKTEKLWKSVLFCCY